MTMNCITIYTDNHESFSDIFETILTTPLAENEEKEIDGILVSHSGEVPVDYIDKMKAKPEVAVMKVKRKGITIIQRKDCFEVLVPVTAAVS
ncbi:NAD/NADP transhydrogenase alpha subunit [Brevibacillus ginsengisoli]|uniref:NAD/NADP transhydrogenase alpha subunit n=1 Tax=Brevibacillus ginsengisoli TaxID=363854 RepID=UPI003CF0C5CC